MRVRRFIPNSTVMMLLGVVAFGSITALVNRDYISISWAQDAPNRPAKSQSFEVLNADPDELVARVHRLLNEVAGPADVYIDRRTGQLVVEGSEEARRIAAQLVKTLDRRSPDTNRSDVAEEPVIKGYRVPADQLESMVNRLKRRFGRDAVAIGSETRTKQVVVHAVPAVQQQVANFIRQLEDDERQDQHRPSRLPIPDRDQETTGPSRRETNNSIGETNLDTNREPNRQSNREANREPNRPSSRDSIRVAGQNRGSHQLRNLTSNELISAIKRIWGELAIFSKENEDGVSTARIPSGDGSPVLVQIDHKSDRVAAVGTNPIRESVEKIVDAIDQPPGQTKNNAQVVPVRASDRQQVEKAITAIMASYTGASDDVTVAVPNRAARKNLNPTRLASRFPQDQNNAVGQNEPNRDRQPVNDENQNTDEDSGLIGPVQIEFIEALGIYIIRGNRRDVERVVKLIEQIESTIKPPMVEIRMLQHVSSVALADMLNQIYAQILTERQGRISITPLVKPNALLLIGSEDGVVQVNSLIAKLDTDDTPPDALWRVFKLKHSSATETEATIRNLFSGITTAPGGAGGQAQPGGVPGGGPGGQGPIGGPGAFGQAQAPTGLRPRITVLSDYRSNSLVVQASVRDLEEVQKLINELDVEGSQAKSEIRIFKLTNTLAQELAPVLQDAIRGQTSTRPGGQQGQPGGQQFFGPQGGQQGQQQGQGANQQNRPLTSMNLELIQIDPTTGKRLVQASGVATDVTVSADVAVNALIVRAPAKVMELIAALVKELDMGPQATAQIKVFTIVNGDATYLGQTLQQLFGQQVTIGRGAGGAFTGGGFGAAGAFPGLATQNLTGAGETNLVPLRFAIDARSNSIIASGSGPDLSVVEVLLLRLDETTVRSRRISVYRLRNAFAQDVATAITNFLTSQRTLFAQDQLYNNSVSPFDQLERQIIVVPEPQSNSVIVSATPNFAESINKMINQLDFRPSMVMVQTLIAEVQLTDVYEFGIELGLQDSLLFDRGKAALASQYPPASPGFNFNNVTLPNLNSRLQDTLAAQGLTGFGLGRSNATLGYNGMVLSAANESINLLVRALQDNNRLQVLSRPEVMAIHNRPAQILVGQKVPRITNSTINNLGNTQNTLQDVDVGIILNIIPQINDDGVVMLYVEAQKSVVGPEEQGIVVTTNAQGIPVRSPRIDTTSAFTTISARDGQTVVFAGLITSSKQMIVRRVPYLSDIPVLGRLFRFDNEAQKRTELLIIMTPKIVKYDADYEWVNTTESERMNWCLSDVVAVHGDVGLRGGSCLFCKDNLPICYPDADPTGLQYFSEPDGQAPAEGAATPMTPQAEDGAYFGRSPENAGIVQESEWNPTNPRASTSRKSAPSSRTGARRPANDSGAMQRAPRGGQTYPVAPAEFYPDQAPANYQRPPQSDQGNFGSVAPASYR